MTVFKFVERWLETKPRFTLAQASGDRNPSRRSFSGAGRSSTARPYRSSRRETRKSDTWARLSLLAAPALVSPAVCSPHPLFLSYQAACSTRRTTAASRADLHRGQTWPATVDATFRPAAFFTKRTFPGTEWVQMGQYTNASATAVVTGETSFLSIT